MPFLCRWDKLAQDWEARNEAHEKHLSRSRQGEEDGVTKGELLCDPNPGALVVEPSGSGELDEPMEMSSPQKTQVEAEDKVMEFSETNETTSSCDFCVLRYAERNSFHVGKPLI